MADEDEVITMYVDPVDAGLLEMEGRTMGGGKNEAASQRIADALDEIRNNGRASLRGTNRPSKGKAH